MRVRMVLAVICSVVFLPHAANALQMMQRGRLHLYFSDGQFDKASELLNASGPIISYLGDMGLRPKKPLHIVLDSSLDEPRVRVSVIPHREIRIPLRAPGVLEDGSDEADPWLYFLFMGLSAHGIYSERSGIPGKAHRLFGEIISPNIILPDWCIDGIGFLLYKKYTEKQRHAPLSDTILMTGPIPDLDIVSNHPDVWPGRFSYRIFGRPFIQWLDQRYGWDKLVQILQLHGKGIFPIEIDSEARIVFGKSWDALWQEFREEHVAEAAGPPVGWHIVGYWHEPFTYWNEVGVYPGANRSGLRSRYGYVDPNHWLLLSEYDERGISKLRSLRRDQFRTAPRNHTWDPGPGGVAVSRKGRRPHLVLYERPPRNRLFGHFGKSDTITRWIEAPPGVIQLSGPVMDSDGSIAVAGNVSGNWDIWMYNGQWHQITRSPSIEMDPWLENGQLLFSSNISGRFQIHAHDMQQLTRSPSAAILPRGQTYLELGPGGWFPKNLPLNLPIEFAITAKVATETPLPILEISNSLPYSPWKSLMPNYIVPDLFTDFDSLQIGLYTQGRDVTGRFLFDTGIRYAFQEDMVSWRLGGKARNWVGRATRYPFGYTTGRQMQVDEIRSDFKVGWIPLGDSSMELSLNWRYFTPQTGELQSDDVWWGSVHFPYAIGNWHTQTTIDLFSGGSQSIYGGAVYHFGQQFTSWLRIEAGKTWGNFDAGHNSFRIGGNAAEGYFTQRPTRLFPLRGFDENILDAPQFVTTGIETLWPLFYLQSGYKTLPVFLRNISLGAFIDSGIASASFSKDDLLVGGGFELVTGMQLAWGYNANFRISLAWPLKQPEYLNQDGPTFMVLIGKPL